MKALVTGSNGFIGSFLVKKLLYEGQEVRCLIRKTSNTRWLENLDIEFCYGDLGDAASLRPALSHVDIIYHLGGITRGRREQDYIDGNYTTTTNLLNANLSYGPAHQKVVFVSSQAAGGPSNHGELLTEEKGTHPISMYGRSKRMAEHAVLKIASERPVTVIRPPSVYGPRDKDFFRLFQYAHSGFMPMVGDGQQQISMIYIDDLIDGIYRAGVQTESDGEIFYLSSDESVSFSQIGEAISTSLNKKTLTIKTPIWTVKVVSNFSSLVSFFTRKPAIINKDKVMEMKQLGWLCSNAKAKKILGFQPKVKLKEGMSLTAAWYTEQGWL